MAADEKWYFTKDQLQNTPSRRCGFDADKELSYRQQAANFIQDMGQKLQVSQLCINTAIVYMHRFYMFHSFTHFPWNTIAASSFFLAAKVEEQPRKLEHVIRIANHCLHRDQQPAFDAKSEQYAAQSQDLVFNENVLLQTLGFDVAIDHPHTHVVRCCHLVRASKDLAQTSYFMASNSLHLTTMCLQYKPTVVACFCIHLACKWSNWQIPKSTEDKDWFYYVDKTVTSDLLEQLTAEFLKIFDKCPSRLKRKISSITTINQNHGISLEQQLHGHGPGPSNSSSPFDPDSRKLHNFDKESQGVPSFHSRSHHEPKPGTDEGIHKKPVRVHDPATVAREREYREKKERERLDREKAAKVASSTSLTSSKHMPHHRPPAPQSTAAPADTTAPKVKPHHAPNMANGRSDRDRERDRDKYLAQQQPQKVVGPDGKIPVKQHDPNLNRHRDRHPKPQPPPVVNSAKPSVPPPVTTPSAQDKNYINKQISSTSQRHKSPPSKANGSAETSPPPPLLPPPVLKKPSSLFSPEKTPPREVKKSTVAPPPLSPFEKDKSATSTPTSLRRLRTSSSGSEPELRPVVKKLDQTPGFENIIRDSKMGIKLPKVPDIIQPICDRAADKTEPSISKELKPPDIIKPFNTSLESHPVASAPTCTPLVNGIETDPAAISTLLKEAAPGPNHLADTEPVPVSASVSAAPETTTPAPAAATDDKHKSDHHHKSEKKKKKDKHKHKDKDKGRDEKKKKHKDKDKERHKSKPDKTENPPDNIEVPLKITISKDKVQPVLDSGLKVKISKDRLKTDVIDPPSTLKIKISKDQIHQIQYNSVVDSGVTSSGSRKRERDKNSSSAPPPKVPKTSYGRDSRQNGRTSYNKVAQLGVGETTQVRLAESKYHSKGASKTS